MIQITPSIPNEIAYLFPKLIFVLILLKLNKPIVNPINLYEFNDNF